MEKAKKIDGISVTSTIKLLTNCFELDWHAQLVPFITKCVALSTTKTFVYSSLNLVSM